MFENIKEEIRQRACELGELPIERGKWLWHYDINRIVKGLSNEYRKLYKLTLEGGSSRNGGYTNGVHDYKTHDLGVFTEIYVNEFYQVEKQLKFALSAFDRHGIKDLPRLALQGGMAKPRVFLLAHELVNRCNAAIDVNSLTAFFEAYQTKSPLKTREIGLIPDMLRMALIEKLYILTMSDKPDGERTRLLQNILRSLQRLNEADMEEAYLSLNMVNRTLSEDKVYKDMDNASQNLYLNELAIIARKCRASETAVASIAIKLTENRPKRENHVGYFIIGEGRKELISKLCPNKSCNPLSQNTKLTLFITVQLVLTILVLLPIIVEGVWSAILAVLPATIIVNSILIGILTRIVRPKPLPRLSCEYGIGEENRTLVCVPVLITSASSIETAIHTLESHYLASKLDNTEFAVLGDFPDSRKQTLDGEDELIIFAKKLTASLNAKYPIETGDRFHYLHRKRVLNNYDSLYMGHERKRGAVNALMLMLKGNDSDDFICNYPAIQGTFKYLTVLDADTVMPNGALKQLIGAASHPLNRPVYVSSEARRPMHGYTIIAPRMVSTSRSAAASRFAHLISGDAGMNPYNMAVSDFYQDVFAEGCFGGKGIIDISAFLRGTEGIIPDNTVLSHDMLEGCICRSAFADDIVLYDGEPSSFASWWKRRHRWLRGDFQLLPFLVGKLRNTTNALGKYKIFDNIRRGIGNISIFATLVVGCVFGMPMLTGWVLLAFFIDPIISILSAFITAFNEKVSIRPIVLLIRRRLMELATLPYSAYHDADAIARALHRMLFSHKKMLEWQTAADSKKGKDSSLLGYIKLLLPCELSAAVLVTASILGMVGLLPTLYSTLPIGLFILLAPIFVRNLDGKSKSYSFTDDERLFLTELFKKNWRYFEENCTESTFYLPPDNYQETPFKGTATLTSPTNIGMGIMAVVSAHDMKIIDEKGMISRLDRMISTIERMEKWNGHLFNWYSIADLSLLKPRFISSVDSGNLFACLISAAEALKDIEGEDAKKLSARCMVLAENMDFKALYDNKRKLFHIGLEFDEGRLTNSWYDLLASESRLMSFAVIAMGQVGTEHWFRLSRLMSDADGGRILKSWSGTIFEYLMPLIFLEVIPHSMQYEVCRNAVVTQILAANGKHPWGVSESGYYAFDRNLRYQYRAFGNPELGLAPFREKADVIAPYATVLALMIEPQYAVENLKELEKIGAVGRYGMYEAIDHTGIRVGDKPFEIVKSFMAHHQGMSLCSINNALNDNVLVKRFMRIPGVCANEQLLFESMPVDPIKINTYESCLITEENKHLDVENYLIAAENEQPSGGLVSNGKYSVFMNSEGRGFSKCGDTMLTRFDKTQRGANGIEFVIKCGESVFDCSGKLNIEPHKLCLNGRHGNIKTKLEIVASAEFNCEIRSLTIINCGKTTEDIVIGAFAEVALAARSEDEAHPAFVRICTDSEYVDGAVLFNSRKRPDREERFGFFSIIAVEEVAYCTDGLIIPGRLNSHKDAMFINPTELTASNPVEPYFSARTNLRIAPGESGKVLLIAGICGSRAEALGIIKEQKLRLSGAEELSRAQSRGILRIFGMDAALYRKAECLAYRIIMGVPHKRPIGGMDIQLHGVSELWRFGISGDRSIILMRVQKHSELKKMQEYIKIMLYMREMGVEFDFVVIGEYPHEYANRLRLNIEEILKNIPNAILLHGFLLTDVDRAFLYGAALIATDTDSEIDFVEEGISIAVGRGHIAKKIDGLGMKATETLAVEQKKLVNFNGYGGFDTDTGEYIIYIKGKKRTPLPWSNIIANEHFGTLITESGGGFTFRDNARLARLTPWSNDAVHDTPGERLTVFDMERNEVLELTPDGTKSEYEIKHGLGYTVFACKTADADYKLTETVDGDLSIKYYNISIRNKLGNPIQRRILLSVDWVLGDSIRKETLYAEGMVSGVVARNLLSESDECGFIALKSGAELKEVSANEILVETVIRANSTQETTLILGSGNRQHIQEMIEYADFDTAISHHEGFKREKLERITVKTDDKNFDAIVNGHLLYQTYASRLMGRTGFYQSGGAIGFRDQLQDVLALLLSDPMRSRKQLLLCASKQFERGDVLHWWHGDGRGVRTHITDDRLFLPYAAAEYAESTGDHPIFNEIVPYLEDVPIPEGKKDIYQIMLNGDAKGSMYDHCIRAIECSLSFGSHGLPLMGSGDWNDSMDNVGENGGESVFLGWFLVVTIDKFIPICMMRGDIPTAEKLEAEARRLRECLEKYAWDGRSYVRAFFGDGTALGGCGGSGECEIDCVSECFAVFAGAKHSDKAFDAVLENLVDTKNGIIKLLTPPFNGRNGHRIGYIEGYLPGIRENGGQYTHAAAWCVIAACMLGRADTAQYLFKLINPAEHGGVLAIERYRGEPYAAAGDVYSEGRLAGRAGWTWYTGAAGWLYRAATEYILGLKKRGSKLYIAPCTPMDSFEIEYRYGEQGRTFYSIKAKRTGKRNTVCDGKNVEYVNLYDDGKKHRVIVEF